MELTSHAREQGTGVTVTRFWKQGSVDYRKVPQLQGVDLAPFRRQGAEEVRVILPDIIDRCQNHVMAGSRVRRHYLHHEFADEKKAAWEKLGQRIDDILAQAGTT